MISTCRRAHDQYLSPSQPFMEYNPSLFLTLSLHVHFQSNIFIISHLIFLYLTCSCPYSYNHMVTAVTYFYYRSLTYHEYILPETNKFNWTNRKARFWRNVPIFSFMCMFCRSLFVLCILVIVFSVLLRYTDSDYHFGFFKLFFLKSIVTCAQSAQMTNDSTAKSILIKKLRRPCVLTNTWPPPSVVHD